MTNSFPSLINHSISEIEDFAKIDAGKEWESSWYYNLKQLILRDASESRPERACPNLSFSVDIFMWYRY